jgi:hypothetical protein
MRRIELLKAVGADLDEPGIANALDERRVSTDHGRCEDHAHD